MKRGRHDKLIKTVETMLGARTRTISFPGGKRRKTARLELEDGRKIIATRREDARSAILEARVLKALAARGGEVPAVLAFNGRVLIQEDLGDLRLSRALDEASPETLERLLDEALASLARLHRAGSEAGLDHAVPQLGQKHEWLHHLLARPQAFSRAFDLAPPRLPLPELHMLLRVERRRMIKWDARPANAMLTASGRLAWFDFEDCGARQRLDDVAWLLCDEYVPDHPQIEARLIDRHLPAFLDGADERRGRHYLDAYGVFHSLVRLGLILRNKADKPWWDWSYCLERDKPGVTFEATQRSIARASRWAARYPLTAEMVPWFEQLSQRIAERLPPNA